MSVTRNNHYVPQWYQEGFFEPGRSSLAYVDMTPDRQVLADGRVITQRGAWDDTPTSLAFRQKDLYSTFFGTSVNDEIERRLFGDVDTRGSQAIRAFIGTDMREWHDHFQDFFEFLDIQKIRTPKGLDWLKAQYPALTQNELMFEMQGIRMLHCAIWVGGVREIVSAEGSDVKFITSDHPVTIYNHAVPPADGACAYPLDPGIALRGSQTLYPMDRDHCLILTNLEYAKDPSIGPLQKKTFARNYRQSITKIDSFIRERKLTAQAVAEINFIVKKRARRYIGGGRKEWLYPERIVTQSWSELQKTLMPPELGLLEFGGEIFVKYESGDVHYQDEFGRTEKPREFLIKRPPDKPLRPGNYCGCGRGKSFKECCQSKPEALRPAWNEKSIRERNLMLQNAIVNVLELESGKELGADPPRADRREDRQDLQSLRSAVAARDRSARAAAQARRRGSRHLHWVHPPVVDHGLRLGGSPVLRRADRGAPVRPPRNNEKGDEPDRQPEVLSAGVPEDDFVLPERHAARRSRLNQPHTGPLRLRLPSSRADDEHGTSSSSAVRSEG